MVSPWGSQQPKKLLSPSDRAAAARPRRQSLDGAQAGRIAPGALSRDVSSMRDVGAGRRSGTTPLPDLSLPPPAGASGSHRGSSVSPIGTSAAGGLGGGGGGGAGGTSEGSPTRATARTPPSRVALDAESASPTPTSRPISPRVLQRLASGPDSDSGDGSDRGSTQRRRSSPAHSLDTNDPFGAEVRRSKSSRRRSLLVRTRLPSLERLEVRPSPPVVVVRVAAVCDVQRLIAPCGCAIAPCGCALPLRRCCWSAGGVGRVEPPPCTVLVDTHARSIVQVVWSESKEHRHVATAIDADRPV